LALVDPYYFGALETKSSHQTLLVESESVDPALCIMLVVKLRAIPLSTITTLGPVPISQPRVVLIQSTALPASVPATSAIAIPSALMFGGSAAGNS